MNRPGTRKPVRRSARLASTNLGPNKKHIERRPSKRASGGNGMSKTVAAKKPKVQNNTPKTFFNLPENLRKKVYNHSFVQTSSLSKMLRQVQWNDDKFHALMTRWRRIIHTLPPHELMRNTELFAYYLIDLDGLTYFHPSKNDEDSTPQVVNHQRLVEEYLLFLKEGTVTAPMLLRFLASNLETWRTALKRDPKTLDLHLSLDSSYSFLLDTIADLAYFMKVQAHNLNVTGRDRLLRVCRDIGFMMVKAIHFRSVQYYSNIDRDDEQREIINYALTAVALLSKMDGAFRPAYLAAAAEQLFWYFSSEAYETKHKVNHEGALFWSHESYRAFYPGALDALGHGVRNTQWCKAVLTDMFRKQGSTSLPGYRTLVEYFMYYIVGLNQFQLVDWYIKTFGVDVNVKPPTLFFGKTHPLVRVNTASKSWFQIALSRRCERSALAIVRAGYKFGVRPPPLPSRRTRNIFGNSNVILSNNNNNNNRTGWPGRDDVNALLNTPATDAGTQALRRKVWAALIKQHPHAQRRFARL